MLQRGGTEQLDRAAAVVGQRLAVRRETRRAPRNAGANFLRRQVADLDIIEAGQLVVEKAGLSRKSFSVGRKREGNQRRFVKADVDRPGAIEDIEGRPFRGPSPDRKA